MHLQVGFAVDRMDRPPEFVEGRQVHQMHGEPQRHAHGDGQGGHDHAGGAGAPLAQHHPTQGQRAGARVTRHGAA